MLLEGQLCGSLIVHVLLGHLQTPQGRGRGSEAAVLPSIGLLVELRGHQRVLLLTFVLIT